MEFGSVLAETLQFHFCLQNTQTHRMAVKTNQEMDTMHAQSVSSPRPAEELV